MRQVAAELEKGDTNTPEVDLRIIPVFLSRVRDLIAGL